MNAIAKIGLLKAKQDTGKCCWDYDYIYYNSRTVHDGYENSDIPNYYRKDRNPKNKKRNRKAYFRRQFRKPYAKIVRVGSSATCSQKLGDGTNGKHVPKMWLFSHGGYLHFINSREERICVIKCYTLKILIYSINTKNGRKLDTG